MTGQPITILVADDNALVRGGVVSFIKLEPDFQLVAEATDGLEAVELWHRYRPKVTLIDLHMPVMDGVAAIEIIRREDARALIVILTAYDGEADIYRGVTAGAKGYVLKDVEPKLLMQCIRKVAAGGTHIPPSVALKLDSHLAQEALTGRETEVLCLVAEGYSNAAVGEKLFISEGTVKCHMKSVLKKLDATSRTEAVALALRRGLLLRQISSGQSFPCPSGR